MSTKRGRFFSSIGETISRSRSTRRFRNVAKSPEFDEGKFRNRAGSHLEEAEQQRIMIGNLVKTGKLSIEEAMQFAEVTGLTENKDPEENMTYNFGVYKHTKDRSRTEKCILQFDFNEQVLSTITKGKFGKNVPFSDVRDYDSEDGVRFILYLDDGEVEYDADDPEEKNKICNLLDGIVEDNKNSQYSEYSGYGSLPRARHSTSTKKLLKEGQIEKRGHSAAFLTWSKRYLRISEGELAYYKVGEEHMTALNLIKLGPGHAFIKKLENNGFVISTQKKEYSFRVVNTNNSKDAAAVNKERDEWFDALTEGVQPSFPVPTTPIPAKSQSPAYAKQDLLSTALDQEEYLKKTVESLQKELEQLMSIMSVVQAPVQATSQMKKVQEIVKTLDVQIKTGLLAWTMKSVVAMNCILPNSSTNEKSSNKQHGIEGLFTIPESSHGAGDIGAGHTTTQGIASHGTAAGGVSGNTAGISSGTTLSGTACSVQEHGTTTTSTSGASGDMAAATMVPGHTSTSSKPNDAPGVASNNEMVENHAPSLQGPTAFPFPDQTTPQPLQPKTCSEDLSPPVPPYAPSSLTSPFSPPPPPLPGIGGVPTPPPFGMVSPLPAKPLIKPNVKVRPFYWAKVPDSMVLSSMWGKAKDRVDEIDLKMIDELFRVEEKPGTPDLAQRSKKIAPKSLMDNKRAQNLGIFLSGFKLTAQDVDRKLDVIDDNDGGLPLEVVIALKRFQPTTEESEMYKNYKGDKEALPKTDQFMIKVCEIPNLTARLDLLLFILEFPLQYDELSPTVTTVLESCNEILQNDKFNVVMEYILAIGNYLNGSTNRGAAHGFKIASLPKLVDTRGRDKNYTLMSLLVDMLSVKEGETLSLHEDMKSVKHAAEASVKGLKAEVEVLWKGLAKIKKLNTELQTKRKTLNESDSKFHEDINIFVSEYEMRLLDLNKRCDDMKEKYAKLLVLLGEPSSKSSEEVFGYLNKFLAQFSAAVKEQTKANSPRNNNRNNNQTSIKGGKMSFKPPALSSDQAKLNQMIGELKGMQATSTKSLKRGKSADSLQVTSPSKGQEQSPSKGQEQPPSKGQEQSPSKGQEQSSSTGQEQSSSKGQEQSPSKGQEQPPSKGQEQSSSKEQEQSQPPPVNRTKPAVSKPPAAGKTSSPTKRPTRQGVLDKLSGGKHKQPKWDTRYFELDDSGHLHYFKKAEGKVVNSIYLRGAPVSIDEDDRCLIKIQTEDRTFQIRASNATEAVAWKNDLSCYT